MLFLLFFFCVNEIPRYQETLLAYYSCYFSFMSDKIYISCCKEHWWQYFCCRVVIFPLLVNNIPRCQETILTYYSFYFSVVLTTKESHAATNINDVIFVVSFTCQQVSTTNNLIIWVVIIVWWRCENLALPWTSSGNKQFTCYCSQ